MFHWNNWLWLVIASSIFLCSVLIYASNASAHDHNRPALNGWYQALKSGKGPCCDGTDAIHITDADWESRDGHYRVKVPATGIGFERFTKGDRSVEMAWVDVPEDAVINQPNLDGATMVWPMYGYMGMTIRCFMPGTMT